MKKTSRFEIGDTYATVEGLLSIVRRTKASIWVKFPDGYVQRTPVDTITVYSGDQGVVETYEAADALTSRNKFKDGDCL